MTGRLEGKNIVLGVCGGIAAYKAVELVRLMTKAGAGVRVIMTENARWFVGPGTFEALCGRPVCTTIFAEGAEASIRHIDWAREADAAVIAPATANMVAKLANGIADDALSTFLLALTAPVIVAPSMNTHMYQHPAVQRNLDILRGFGHTLLVPGEGVLACGTTGPGRLPEPQEILDRLVARLSPKDLAGKNVLVTAGPTREPMDPVRFISNPSTGKMGFAVARAAEHRGARVTLVTGPVTLPDLPNVTTLRVGTAREMAEVVFSLAPDAHIVVKTAAVSDYRPLETAPHKIKKGDADIPVVLTRNPDILRELGKRKAGQFLVGFAAETRDLAENAAKKIQEKNLDLIVGNLVGGADAGFAADTNRVTLFYRDGSSEALPAMEKEEVAHFLLDRVVSRLLV